MGRLIDDTCIGDGHRMPVKIRACDTPCMEHGPLHADLALDTPRRFAVAGLTLAASALITLWAFLLIAFGSPVAGSSTLTAQVLFGGFVRWWAQTHDPSRRAPAARAIAGAIALPASLMLVILGVQFLTA